MGSSHLANNNTRSDPSHRYKFYFSVTQAQPEQQTKSQSKTVTSCLLEGNLPQLWDGFMWLTPGYGHLSSKAPLFWEQLNHTKDNQLSNVTSTADFFQFFIQNVYL